MSDNRQVPFGKPQIGEEELSAVTDVLRSGILVHGKITPAFEAAFAQRIGTKHAVAVSSCTAGLHLTLFVKGVGPGDRVAIPAMTHVATAHSVELCGATPVFVDVEEDTGNMDAGILQSLDGPMRAVIPVHYLGLPCEMGRINRYAEQKDAFVLEDCALAVDSTYAGRKAGGLGLAGSFSFYPVKHMTSIEGGMITTDDDELAAQLRKRRAFGYNRALGERTRPGIYDVDELGFNYRMSEVEAAVGLAQLPKLDGWAQKRKANYERLRARLLEIDGITVFASERGEAKGSHYCLNAVLPRNGSLKRDEIVDHLSENGIGSSVHYPSAVPLFTYYKERYGYKSGQFPVAEWLAEQTISLPVGPHIEDSDVNRIADTFKEAVRKARNG